MMGNSIRHKWVKLAVIRPYTSVSFTVQSLWEKVFGVSKEGLVFDAILYQFGLTFSLLEATCRLLITFANSLDPDQDP